MAAAARAVHAVLADGVASEQALAQHTGSAPRAPVQAVVLGTLRWYLRLAPAVLPLAGERNRLEPLLRALLAVAAHQLEYSGHAPAATVAAAVDAARLLGQPRAAGLVNAVLRRFLRERAECFRPVDARRRLQDQPQILEIEGWRRTVAASATEAGRPKIAAGENRVFVADFQSRRQSIDRADVREAAPQQVGHEVAPDEATAASHQDHAVFHR